MAALILLEGNAPTVELVGQALHYSTNAIIVDAQGADKSVTRLIGQLSAMAQVAQQSEVPIIFKNVHFSRKVSADKREAVGQHMLDLGCKLILVVDSESATQPRDWLQEAYDGSELDKVQYDITTPVPELIRFVKGE